MAVNRYDDTRAWYTISTYSGYEDKVADSIKSLRAKSLTQSSPKKNALKSRTANAKSWTAKSSRATS